MKSKKAANTSLKVLRLSDSPRDTRIIRKVLLGEGYDLSMDCTAQKMEFASLLRTGKYDVIISDFKLTGCDAFEALQLVAENAPGVSFICVSGPVGDHADVTLKQQGAVDVIARDFAATLPSAITRALTRGKNGQQVKESLYVDERLYHALLTSLPDAVYIEVGDRITLVNPALCQLLDIDDPLGLIGKSVYTIVHPDYHEKVRERLNLVLAGHSAPPLEEKFLRHDGTVVDVDVHSYPVDWHGSRGVLVTARDITGRKQTDEAIIASELRYRRLFEAARDGIVMIEGETGKIVDVNLTATKMLGYSRSHLLGLTVWELGFLNEMFDNKKDFLKLQQAGYIQYQDRVLECADGRHFDVDIIGTMYEENHRIVILCNIRDITERKREQEAVRESEGRFRMVFENAFDGISIYSEDPDPRKRRLVECNTRYASMAGRTREELLQHGTTLGFQIPLGDTSNTTRLKSLATETAYSGFFSWIRPDGKENVNEYVGMPITWQGKSYTIGIDRDITERKKSEELRRLLTTALESTANGVAISDIKGNILWVNKAFTKMTGYPPAEVLGQNLRILKSGKQDGSFYKALWDTISEGKVWNGELVNRKKNGGMYAEEMTITPLMDRNGEITNYIAIKQDITKRKYDERTLKFMAQTITSMQDCVAITDLDGRILFTNNAFQVNYGYTNEDLLGKNVSMLRAHHTLTAMRNQIHHDTRGGGWHGEILDRRKDGTDLPVELWTSMVSDESGTPVAMLSITRNIADRQLAKDNLRKSEEQFRLIADNVGDMIAVLDPDGRRIYNSPSYASILGNAELLKGTDSFQDVRPEDRDMVKNVFQETVTTGVGRRIEYRLSHKDGSVRTIDSKGSVIKDGQGRVSQVIVVSRDVTEERKLAAQFLRAQRLESIGTLASGIAHDLNNIFTPIMLSIEILRSYLPGKDGANILDTIETSAKRGSDIVKQVLAFGRGIEGKRVLVQLKHVVNDVVKIAGETFSKAIEINSDMPRDLWTVLADPTQMHQVVLNMVVNARDAMPHGGTLTISAKNVNIDEESSLLHFEAKPGAFACIIIADTGTGIPAEFLDKIFEPFFTTKDVGLGTALGLSTTLAIVRSHNGFIDLHSELGKGTTFNVYIPATGTAAVATAANVSAVSPKGNGELILVIDDEEAIRTVAVQTLKANGYKVVAACNGAEGVAVFANHKATITLVITDMMMPVMDGPATILELRKIDPNVKVIASSGLTAKEHAATPPGFNVAAFLTKPYGAKVLLKIVSEVLG